MFENTSFRINLKVIQNYNLFLPFLFSCAPYSSSAQCPSFRFGGPWSSPNVKFSKLREIKQYKQSFIITLLLEADTYVNLFQNCNIALSRYYRYHLTWILKVNVFGSTSGL